MLNGNRIKYVIGSDDSGRATGKDTSELLKSGWLTVDQARQIAAE
jgi:hypothetical protein